MAPIRRRTIVYTILADHRPVVTFKGTSQQEARELLRESWFLDELRSKGVWDGRALLTARSALPDEQKQYEANARDDASGDMALVYLVEID
jgi:hypothetical protein